MTEVAGLAVDHNVAMVIVCGFVGCALILTIAVVIRMFSGRKDG